LRSLLSCRPIEYDLLVASTALQISTNHGIL